MANRLMNQLPMMTWDKKRRLAHILQVIKQRRMLRAMLSDTSYRRKAVMRRAHLLEKQGIPYGVAQSVAWHEINKFMEV